MALKQLQGYVIFRNKNINKEKKGKNESLHIEDLNAMKLAKLPTRVTVLVVFFLQKVRISEKQKLIQNGGITDHSL